MLEFTTICLQIVLPLALVAWLAFAPSGNRIGLIAQITGIGLALLAMTLAMVWLIPPWWTPYVYIGLWSVAAIRALLNRDRQRPWAPQNTIGWIPTIAIAGLAIWATGISLSAIEGRRAPSDIDVVDIPFPMDPCLYLFAHGGSTATVNAHFLTLNPKTERQRAYRGQTYSVDFVKIDKFGLRADGWRPADPSVYNIFNQPVYSPCHGEVITADDKMPDMQVPQLDRSRLEGNHVLINCGDFAILLAHLKNGTVEVAMGDRVVTGQRLGLAGNSGQTGEPHMHIHAQRLPAEGPPLSGEPIFLTLNGKFPVRNSVFRVRTQETAAEALATEPNSEQ